MTSRYPQAIGWSTMMHLIAIGVVIFVTWFTQRHLREAPMSFELVAAEGDNFTATEAPKLGNTLKMPPAPAPVEPVEVAPPSPPIATVPTPVQPTPTPRSTSTPRSMPTPTPAPTSQPQPRTAPRSTQTTFEEFSKQNAGKKQPAPAKAPAVKAPQIDVEGIAKGTKGGSTTNKTAGAGGKAMTAEIRNEMGAYWALFNSKLREQIELAPGLSDTLSATLRVTVSADGTLSELQIVKKSRNPDFDRAILKAAAAIKLRPKPDGKNETVDIPINLKDISSQ